MAYANQDSIYLRISFVAFSEPTTAKAFGKTGPDQHKRTLFCKSAYDTVIGDYAAMHY